MGFGSIQLRRFMHHISPDHSASFKMLLYHADLGGQFERDEDWDEVCRFALSEDRAHEFTSAFQRRYLSAGGEDLASLIKADMQDNYILGAIALAQVGAEKSLPVIPWNAFNRHSYEGLQGEFAVVRFLHWAGFDINAADSQGMTALHYFASQQYFPGTNPRAVKWLVQHGGNVAARNEMGDTPLIYSSGVQTWGRPNTESFVYMFSGGADPWAASDDGTTAISLLEQLDEQEPSVERRALIDEVAKFRDQANAKRPTLDEPPAGNGQLPEPVALPRPPDDDVASDDSIIRRGNELLGGSVLKFQLKKVANAMEAFADMKATWAYTGGDVAKLLRNNPNKDQVRRKCAACLGPYFDSEEAWANHFLSVGHYLTMYRTTQAEIDEARAYLHAFPFEDVNLISSGRSDDEVSRMFLSRAGASTNRSIE